MSRVIAKCPHCSKQYKVDPQLLGRSTDCKQCKNNFKIALANDSEDSFGLPDAKQFLSNQPFDPLAPPRVGEHDPAQTYEDENRPEPESVKARDWKKEIRAKKLGKPFGPIQKALLGLGVCLILGGIVLSLVHLFGVQVGEGNVGKFIGLAVGLLGAGLVGASLLKFPSSARIAGAAAALVVFLVFMAAIFSPGKKAGEVVEEETTSDNRLAQFDSPWLEKYPNWVGFENMQKMPNISDRWNRHQIADSEFSASFPGKPIADTGRVRVTKTNVGTRELASEINGFKFYIQTFKFPTPRGKNENLKLNESELALGEIEFAKSIEYDGKIGKEYRITDTAESVHGRFFLVDDEIIHARVTGNSTLVPGVMSREFLESLQLRSDGNLAHQKMPEFELSDEQKGQAEAVSNKSRELEALVAEYIKSGGLMNFPPAYLSISAGKDEGNRKFFVHPGKLPILGVDLVEVRTRKGTLISNISPIYGEATNENSVMAREGYALAGLEVNAGSWVKGIRLVFMEVTPVGFDTARTYRSKWFGTRSSVTPEKVGGDGRPVYGFWLCRTSVVKSIGLIRESN